MKPERPDPSAAAPSCQESQPRGGKRPQVDFPPILAEATRYSCGFLFTPGCPGTDVLLIRKLRPRWQAGRLNGIGGHIEYGETPADTMRREFLEEGGIDIASWDPVAILRGATFEVHFFSAWTDRVTFGSARAMTDEQLEAIPVDNLGRDDIIPNLRVLIPLALDRSGIVKPVILQDGAPQPH